MPQPPSDPSPLGEATEGFAELAGWFVKLVGEQTEAVARQVDNRGFDVDAAAAALARAATLPFVGWAAWLNEIVDAAGIVSTPLWRDRPIRSAAFRAPCLGVSRELVFDGPLTNGFGDELPPPSVIPATLGPEEAEFTLEAPSVPPDCVGVFSGRVAVIPPERDDCAPSEPFVDVWLVVP